MCARARLPTRKLRAASRLLRMRVLLADADPRTPYSPYPKAASTPIWPGDSRDDWLNGTALSAAARSLALAIVNNYGRDGCLSVGALNRINRECGAAGPMEADDETFLLDFNRGRLPASKRALCAEGYVDFVTQWATSDFSECLADLRKLHTALRG